jgi:hypothetical protein
MFWVGKLQEDCSRTAASVMIRPMMGLCERKRERYGYMEMGTK